MSLGQQMIELSGAQEVMGGPAPPDPQLDLRLLLDSAAEGFCSLDRNGAITWCNASFLHMIGFQRAEEVIGKDFHHLVHHSRADGTRYPRSACAVLKTAQTGIPATVTDEVFYRADGTSFPIEYRARPIIHESAIEGAVCTFVDITDRKQAEAKQRVLNHELTHRVKNTLAVVQAIVLQSLRNSDAGKDAVAVIHARLVALGRAHEALTNGRSERAPIAEVVKNGIAVCADGSRIRMDGPRIDVGPNAALALTMALHELCTNGVKYGALSNDTGFVVLEWTVGEGDDAAFHLRWKEQGGPPVTAPKRTGFGSRIIHDYCRSQFHGDAVQSFEPDGLRWTLDAPLRTLEE